MRIVGLQKTTVIDYPGKVACVVFLWGCNFRCGFCHNPELVVEEPREIYSEREILEFLAKRKKYLDGVCITGGEPLLTLDKEFLRKIKTLGYEIKLDTNGSFPEKLEELIKDGLVDFVAMDIKASKEKYEQVAGARVSLDKIEESIKLIGLMENYEFRTTVLEEIHDVEEMRKIANWLNEVVGEIPKKFCIQGFKNQGKFIDLIYKSKKDVGEDYLKILGNAVQDSFESVEIRV